MWIIPAPSGGVVSTASSRALSRLRASPPATSSRWSAASVLITTCRAPKPCSGSARARSSRRCRSCGSSGCSRNSRARLTRALFTSKKGFSVVAPIRLTVPFSTQGRRASCWAVLKRCTSSMNRIVRRPWWASRSRAASTSARRSFTPASTALRLLKWARVLPAMIRARVVLPVPGGPCRIRLPTRSAAMARRSSRPGPRIASCPTKSSRLRGRIRSARGAIWRRVCSRRWLNRSLTAGRARSHPGAAGILWRCGTAADQARLPLWLLQL